MSLNSAIPGIASLFRVIEWIDVQWKPSAPQATLSLPAVDGAYWHCSISTATKVMERFAEFAQAHPEVPWRSMRGMRNRIAHGYFEINLDVVWETVQTALPELLEKQLPAVRQDANKGSW